MTPLMRIFAAIALVFFVTEVSDAGIVIGGGSSGTDCLMVLDIAGANKPAPPKAPKQVDCVDGDPACDQDGERNGQCSFGVTVCLNDTTSVPGCSAEIVDSVFIENSVDDGNPKFDIDMQAIQSRADSLGLPTDFSDDCATASSVTVRLKGPLPNLKMKKQKKKLKATAFGAVPGKDPAKDSNKTKFTCRPEGDAIYLPSDLFDSTFDRIAQQAFVGSCALSACHDSETVAGGLNLLPASAYSTLVDVAPQNGAANAAGLLRIDSSGSVENSFLFRKITNDLELGWGASMPLTGPNLSSQLTDIIMLWIAAGAPETGWVPGTDE